MFRKNSHLHPGWSTKCSNEIKQRDTCQTKNAEQARPEQGTLKARTKQCLATPFSSFARNDIETFYKCLGAVGKTEIETQSYTHVAKTPSCEDDINIA